MFTDTNMLMALHKARESELLHRAESSRIKKLAGSRGFTLGERFIQTIANTLVFLGLR